MKTNTTKLRHALTAFAMTGAILAFSELSAQSLPVVENHERTATEDRKDLNITGKDGGAWKTITPATAENERHISDTIFRNNTLSTPGYDWHGGGVFGILNQTDTPIVTSFKNTEFSGNKAVMTEVVSNEGADFGGGAIFAFGDSEISMTDTTFTNNSASAPYNIPWGDSGGGAILLATENHTASLTLDGTNEFSGNSYKSGAIRSNNMGNGGGAIGIFTSAGGCYSQLELKAGSTNTFDGNFIEIGTASRRYDGASGGGAIYGSCLVGIRIDGTNQFSNNKVTYTPSPVEEGRYPVQVGGGAICNVNWLEDYREYYNYGEECLGELIIRGDNTFTGNSVTATDGSDVYGGAIMGYRILFDGDGSKAVFSNNTINGVKNDVHATLDGAIMFNGAGKYTFDGGITTDANGTMSITGSDVTLQEGSVSKIADTLTLENAKLTIETNGTTPLYVGSIVDNDGNLIHIDYRTNQNSWVIIGDVSDLDQEPSVNYSALQEGEKGRILQMDEEGLYIQIYNNTGTYVHFYADGSPNIYGDYLNVLGDVRENDEILVLKNPENPTPGLTANGTLTFTADNSEAYEIKADGDSTLVSNASELTLDNVTLASDSKTAPIIQGTNVDLTGKGTAGIIGPSAIDAVNVTLSGKLTVDGKITGDTTILENSEVSITQNTDIFSGGLTVKDGVTLTLDSLGMERIPVLGDDGKPVASGETKLVFDTIDVENSIEFADGTTVELVFDETFNLDGRNSYTLITHAEGVTDLSGVEFVFVDLVEEIEGIKMFNIRAIDGAIILDVTGYGTIPEPSTWALLVLGGLGIFGVARKNRKAKK